MKVHPRELICNQARYELTEKLIDVTKKHELTTAEQIRVVAEAMAGWLQDIAKYAIRVERHGDPNKPGGTA